MKFNQSTASFTIALLLIAMCCFCAGFIVRDVKAANEQSKYCTPTRQCQNAIEAQKRLRSYQLETYNDSTVIWDGDRKVVTLLFDSTTTLDKAISFDNQ